MAQAATHPGNQQGNPYYTPNSGLQQAQVQASQVQAPQVPQQGLVPQQQPQGNPLAEQASQVAEGIVRGQIGQEDLMALVQTGQVEKEVADAAFGMAQQFMTSQQGNQGLGGQVTAPQQQPASGLGSFQ